MQSEAGGMAMKYAAILAAEHKAVLRAIRLLRTVTPMVIRNQPQAMEDAVTLVAFFHEFWEHLHQFKEEILLFPRLKQKGLPGDRAPLALLLLEHDQSRALLRNMAKALASQPERFGLYAERFATLVTDHIKKENARLFRRAELLLDNNDDEQLTGAFEDADQQRGEGIQEEFHRKLAVLEERYPPDLAKAV
jgi:hemerythrin-like domain-containing protein